MELLKYLYHKYKIKFHTWELWGACEYHASIQTIEYIINNINENIDFDRILESEIFGYQGGEGPLYLKYYLMEKKLNDI